MNKRTQLAWVGLFNILAVVLLTVAFYVPSPAPTGLNTFGYSIGSVQIAGISLEHEWVFAGIAVVGLVFLNALMIGIGILGYLSDFHNLFIYPYGFYDYTTNPTGSIISLIIGFWVGINLYFILQPSEIGSVRG